jgi:hypothetical protein
MLKRGIKKGDILIGFTVERFTYQRLFAGPTKFSWISIPSLILFQNSNATIGNALLAVHRSYLKVIEPLLNDPELHGLSHITGGGIVGNTRRIVPENLILKIDWQAWQWPPLFEFIRQTGGIAIEEMRHVFNLGIGLVLAVPLRLLIVSGRLYKLLVKNDYSRVKIV